MALTGAKITDEVQALVGRNEDTELIDVTRVTRWQNEAQREIARFLPGMKSLEVDICSWCTDTQLRWDLVDLTVGDETATAMTDTTVSVINRVFGIHYKDGQDSVRLRYTHIDEWDRTSDPTHSDVGLGKPFRYTQRGDQIEIRPLADTGHTGVPLRVIGDRWPVDFTTESTTVSELDRCDKGIILYTVAQAWQAIGDEVKYQLGMRKFSNPDPLPGQDFGWIEKRRRDEDEIHSWDGDLFSDDIVNNGQDYR
jgi:hypothetical protein